jgi:hypothetical protein
MGILDDIQKMGNPDMSKELHAGMQNVFDSVQEAKEKKDRNESRRFWIATIMSFIALILAGISLWLQVRGRL